MDIRLSPLFVYYESCCFECFCTSFRGNMLSILLGLYLVMELLGHTATLFNFLSNCQTIFHSGHTIFTFPSAMHKGSNISTSLTTLITFHFGFYSHPSGYKSYFTVVLIFISLTNNDADHLFI